MDDILDLQRKAQHAGEERLEACNSMLWHDEEGYDADGDHPEWDEIAGPYCGCNTCIVREILDAAWPYLREIALMAEKADAPDSNSGPERGAGSTPAKGTYSDYHRAKELEQSLRKIYHTVVDEYVCLFT